MAYVGGLSSSEMMAVEELQKRMKNVLPVEKFEDVTFFYKFLKARNFDVENAEKMLRKNLRWRKSFQVDTFLEDFQTKEIFHKYIEISDIGLDKDGDLVKYWPLGSIDARDSLKCLKINDYMKHCIWYCEKTFVFLKELSQKTGRECSQISIILDLEKLTFGNATCKQAAEIALRLVRLLIDNYPECLKYAYVIKAPVYYLFVFTILKTMLPGEIIKKVHVFGYSGWREKLLEAIDADVLPGFLGGNRTDPDGNPLCLSFVNHSGNIAEKYYLSNEERYFKDMTQVETLIVPKREKKDIYINVPESGSLIQWEFLIKNNDIGFGLFHEVSEEELKEVLPIQKYDTIDGTEEGYYRAQSVGLYVIVFDNTFSWWSSKEVEYCINVIKPGL